MGAGFAYRNLGLLRYSRPMSMVGLNARAETHGRRDALTDPTDRINFPADRRSVKI